MFEKCFLNPSYPASEGWEETILQIRLRQLTLFASLRCLISRPPSCFGLQISDHATLAFLVFRAGPDKRKSVQMLSNSLMHPLRRRNVDIKKLLIPADGAEARKKGFWFSSSWESKEIKRNSVFFLKKTEDRDLKEDSSFQKLRKQTYYSIQAWLAYKSYESIYREVKLLVQEI